MEDFDYKKYLKNNILLKEDKPNSPPTNNHKEDYEDGLELNNNKELQDIADAYDYVITFSNDNGNYMTVYAENPSDLDGFFLEEIDKALNSLGVEVDWLNKDKVKITKNFIKYPLKGDVKENRINEISQVDILDPKQVKPGMEVWNEGESIGRVLAIDNAEDINGTFMNVMNYDTDEIIDWHSDEFIDKYSPSDYFIAVKVGKSESVVGYYGPHDFYVPKDGGGKPPVDDNGAGKEGGSSNNNHQGAGSPQGLRETIKNIIRKTLQEMSTTGGGTAGASFTPGVGEQYTTKFAFKNKKNGKHTSK